MPKCFYDGPCNAYSYIFLLVLTLAAFIGYFIMDTLDLLHYGKIPNDWGWQIGMIIFLGIMLIWTIVLLILVVSNTLKMRNNASMIDDGDSNDEIVDAETGVVTAEKETKQDDAIVDEDETTTFKDEATSNNEIRGESFIDVSHVMLPIACIGCAVGNGFVLDPQLQSSEFYSGYLESLLIFGVLFLLHLVACCGRESILV